MKSQTCKPVQSLWIGDEFSSIEKLSSSSFLKNGHDYHLYCYNDVKNVPEGVKILDANKIISESEVFSYKNGAGKGSFSAFSNTFRYKLIYENGGFWADTDVVCLKELNFKNDYVFSSEISHFANGKPQGKATASSIFGCVKNSDVMKSCYDICLSKDKEKIVWGEIGPKLLGSEINKHELESFIQPYYFFNPIPWANISGLFDGSVDINLLKDKCYCVHLWNEVWRRNNIDKNDKFNDDCLFEKLKALYL